MAEDRDDSQRTEEPTQRRLDEALKKGDVVKSTELAAFVMMAGSALALALFAGSAASRFATEFMIFLENPAQMELDGGAAVTLLHKAVLGLFAILAPATGLIMAAAVSGHLIQHPPFFSANRLKPD